MTVTGTPPLQASLLSIDPNQSLQFDGSTDSWTVADSTSLSITGSISVSMLLKLTSTPASTKVIFDKTSSYKLEVDTSSRLLWTVTNGGTPPRSRVLR